MADAREKAVIKQLSDLYSRSRYIIDFMTSLRAPLGHGDMIEIPQNSATTVLADGDTSTAPEAITTTVLTLNANLHPWMNVRIPMVASVQLLDGSWAEQTARQSTVQLKNDMDSDLAEYLLTVAYDTSATYHDNVAGDSLSEDDILNCKAALLAQDGVNSEDLVFLVSPFGEASIMSIAGFVPNFQEAERGNLGIPRLGTVFGIPVFASNSIPRNRSIVGTAAVTSGTGTVLTITVGAGHGVVPGMIVTTTGFDATENQASVVVASVTATSIVCTIVGGTDGTSADADGFVQVDSSENIMLDRSHCWVAQQMLPKTRHVGDFNTTREALQISTIWGRVARPGRVRVLHSPASAA